MRHTFATTIVLLVVMIWPSARAEDRLSPAILLTSAAFAGPTQCGLGFDVNYRNDGSAGPLLLQIEGFSAEGLILNDTSDIRPTATVGPQQTASVVMCRLGNEVANVSSIEVELLDVQGTSRAHMLIPVPHLSGTQLQQLSGMLGSSAGSSRDPRSEAGYLQSFDVPWRHQDFPGLDRIFRTENHDEVRTSEGGWALVMFVHAIMFQLGPPRRADSEAEISRWIADEPDSTAAQFAVVLRSLARAERLNQTSKINFNEASGQMVGRSNALVAQLLNGMNRDGKASALWWLLKIDMMLTQIAPAEDLVKVFNSAVQAHPGFGQITIDAATALVRRSQSDLAVAAARTGEGPGVRGEYAAIEQQRRNDWFALDTVAHTGMTKAGGTVGAEVYALTYIQLDTTVCDCAKMFEETRVNWPQMRAGLQLLAAKYPIDGANQNRLAAYACRAEDRSAYFEAMKELPPARVEPRLWKVGYSPDSCEKHFNHAA